MYRSSRARPVASGQTLGNGIVRLFDFGATRAGSTSLLIEPIPLFYIERERERDRRIIVIEGTYLSAKVGKWVVGLNLCCPNSVPV